MAKNKRKRCLIKQCKGDAVSVGLCPKCYQAARRMVASGKTTWAELVEKGLAKESQRDGYQSLMAKAFDES